MMNKIGNEWMRQYVIFSIFVSFGENKGEGEFCLIINYR